MELSQRNRSIKLYTTMGAEALFVQYISGVEQLGKPFNIDISVVLNDFNKGGLSEMVGKPMSMEIKVNDQWVAYHGLVRSFTVDGQTDKGSSNGLIKLVPWLDFLQDRVNCRVFQNKTIVQIAEELFKDGGFSDFRFELKGQYPEYEYKVQYNESDLHFLSRLMEEEGLFYYFEHTKDKHIAVFVDSNGAYFENKVGTHYYNSKVPGKGYLLSVKRTMRMGSAQYVMASQDIDTPKNPLHVVEDLDDTLKTISKGIPENKLEHFEGSWNFTNRNEGSRLSSIKLQAKRCLMDQSEISTDSLTTAVGSKFIIQNSKNADENPEEWVVYQMAWRMNESHIANKSSGQSVNALCIPSRVHYRSPLEHQKPRIFGMELATVTGQDNSEVFANQKDCYKIHFHWDRLGDKNEKSSCWVRCLQNFAGDGYGTFFQPRVGNTVAVSFLQGDPDKPIITGSLYTGGHTPYKLPQDQFRMGMRSRTEGGSRNDFSEISIEDKRGAEEIYLKSHKDMRIEIKNDENKSIGQNQKIDIAKDFSQKVAGKSSHEIGEKFQLTIGGDQTVEVTGNVKQNAGQDFSISSNGQLSASAMSDLLLDSKGSLKLDSMGKIEINAVMGITITCGPASIEMLPTGSINITGTMVSIGGGQVAIQ